MSTSKDTEKKRRLPRALGCRRIILGACIALGLICSLPFLLTAPELQWHFDKNIRLSIITPEPASKESDVIAFICKDIGDTWNDAIYTIHPDGSRLRPIFMRGYQGYSHISWSPDGTWLAAVAYNHYMAILKDEAQEIFLIRWDGLHSKRLTYNRYKEFAPTWSNDGKSIWYFSDNGSYGGFIHRATLDGFPISEFYNQHLVLDIGEFGRRPRLDWSSDDQRIIGIAPYNTLSVGTSPDGSDWQALTRTGVGTKAVAWAPDDERVLYFGNVRSPEYAKLAVFNVEERVEVFAIEMARITEARWSPNGRWISILGRMPGDENEIGLNLYMLDSDTGDLHYFTQLREAGISSTSWSPDGEWLAFTTWKESQLFKIRRDGTDLQQLTDMNCRGVKLSWSPK